MSRFIGFLHGKNQFGRWVPEAEITAHAVMGGATIDFSQAIFTHPVITIYSKAFWGGVTLLVPPNVAVEENGRAIMGGVGSSGGFYYSENGMHQEARMDPKTGVTLKVHGTAVMGAVKVAVNHLAAPAQLVTAEEAARILREVPAEPSTTRQDMVQQALGQVFERLEQPGGQQPAAAAALQHALALHGLGPQRLAPHGAVVQGVPMAAQEPVAGVQGGRGESAPVGAPRAEQALRDHIPSVQEGRGEEAPASATMVAPTNAMAEQAPLDWKAELKELKEMLDAGILTQQEFDAQKAKVLERVK